MKKKMSCPECNGQGVFLTPSFYKNKTISIFNPEYGIKCCWICFGTGIVNKVCKRCGGTGEEKSSSSKVRVKEACNLCFGRRYDYEENERKEREDICIHGNKETCQRCKDIVRHIQKTK